MQTLMKDTNIRTFLNQIPPKEHLVTLKELIYIGIKIVNNSFEAKQLLNHQPQSHHQQQQHHHQHHQHHQQQQQQFINKENQKNYENIVVNLNHSNNINTKKNISTYIKHNNNHNNQSISKLTSTKGVQPTLLREISKIRIQLEDLTNKVYDQCFQQPQSQQVRDGVGDDGLLSSVSFNQKKRKVNNFSFSPSKQQLLKNVSSDRAVVNPFSKKKNNFFIAEQLPQSLTKQNKKRSNSSNQQQQHKELFQQSRNRARSNIMHLDDTQVKQALYNYYSDDDEQCHHNNDNFDHHHQQKQHHQQLLQSSGTSRFKKSKSMVQKRIQGKKKQQQNYFHQLAIDKKRVDELNKIKSVGGAHNQDIHEQPQRDYNTVGSNVAKRHITTTLTAKNNYKKHYNKPVKSKIKQLVQRDRLKYQEQMQNQNFKKGFEQYQYSANEFEDDDVDEDEDDVVEEQEDEEQDQVYQGMEGEVSNSNDNSNINSNSNLNSNSNSHLENQPSYSQVEASRQQQHSQDTSGRNRRLQQQQQDYVVDQENQEYSAYQQDISPPNQQNYQEQQQHEWQQGQMQDSRNPQHRESLNPNFGFYDSHNQQNTQRQQLDKPWQERQVYRHEFVSDQSRPKANSNLNHNHNFNQNILISQQQDSINVCSDSSSFSEFSINGSSRRRIIGKISHRNHD